MIHGNLPTRYKLTDLILFIGGCSFILTLVFLVVIEILMDLLILKSFIGFFTIIAILVCVSLMVVFLFGLNMELKNAQMWKHIQNNNNYLMQQKIELILFRPSVEQLKNNNVNSKDYISHLPYLKTLIFIIDIERRIKIIEILNDKSDSELLNQLNKQNGIKLIVGRKS